MAVNIIIFNGPPGPLSYLPPEGVISDPETGTRVLVPLGRRKALGLVISGSGNQDRQLKRISEIIDHRPVISQDRIEVAFWISRYYRAPLKDVLSLFLLKTHTSTDSLRVFSLIKKNDLDNLRLDDHPRAMAGYIAGRKEVKLSTLKKHYGGKLFFRALTELENTGLIKVGFQDRMPDVSEDIRKISFSDPQEMILNSQQQSAYKAVLEMVEKAEFVPFLLFGVTGSGKSEVYLKLIWDCLKRGKSALLALPEIASSEELYRKLQDKLGNLVCRIHSGLRPNQRLEIWENIREGNYRAIIGPRSALFAPVWDLGLIIVDEEHDSSYKQSGSSPTYHGRDLALVMGRQFNCPVLLGSATPSLESWHNVETGKYRLLRLNQRWDSRPLPKIRPVEFSFTASGTSLSDELLDRMNEVLKADGQVMLLLNRRGFAPTVKCEECGFTYVCPNCSVGLVYHKKDNSLRCHLCDYRIGRAEKCPECAGRAFLYFGAGTQKLQEEIAVAFPNIPCARIDLDSASDRTSLQKTLSAFRAGKIRILIGTQMIAKSFDFPKVSLMGILSADSYLEFPDFRSREKTFALLLQAAGRAGRGKFPGQVVIQHSPLYKEFISELEEEKVEQFLGQEMKAREELFFPPHCHLLLMHIKAPALNQGEDAVGRIADLFFRNKSRIESIFEYYGPSRAPLFKLRNNYRWQLLIKTKAVFKTLDSIDQLLSKSGLSSNLRNVRLSLDVDPVDML